MNIFVVEGATGEYSDRREWPVKAFASEDRAMSLVEQLEAWLRENGMAYDNCGLDYKARESRKPELDPHFQCDYTGVRYLYYAVPFDEDAK